METFSIPTQPLNLNGLGSLIYDVNVKNGWYENPVEMGTRIALIHSEVSELLEADRNSKWTDDPYAAKSVLAIEDDKVFKSAFDSRIKGTGEEEIADIVIRALDLAAHLRIDIHHHVLAKLRRNSMRGHKHGGKQY